MSVVYPIQDRSPQTVREERTAGQRIGRNLFQITQFAIPIITLGLALYYILDDPAPLSDMDGNGLHDSAIEETAKAASAVVAQTTSTALDTAGDIIIITAQAPSLIGLFGAAIQTFRASQKNAMDQALGIPQNPPLFALEEKERHPPQDYIPEIDPSRMGASSQRKISLGIVEDGLDLNLPSNPSCDVSFSSDKAIEKQCSPYWHRKERNEMVSLVNQNHARYANKWGYEHRIQTGNLVAGECLDPDSGEAVDCAPYWNKIVFFRKWLNEPKACPRTEEWHLFMDSDMVVTNQNISLETVIDALRNGNESIIATRDGLNYQRNVGLVNTGLLLIRKDERAKEVIEAIWARRNNEIDVGNPSCKTPGTCKTQQIVHEQEAFGDELHAHPSLYGDVVSIQQSRDIGSAKRRDIALNTYHRPGGCILVHREGRLYRKINHRKHAKLDPNAQWKAGDFTGQVPAFPILGRELPFEPSSGKCIGDWNKAPVASIRKERVLQMLDQTIG